MSERGRKKSPVRSRKSSVSSSSRKKSKQSSKKSSPSSSKSSKSGKSGKQRQQKSPEPRRQPQLVQQDPNLCQIHKKPFTMYNEIEEMPICDQCVAQLAYSGQQSRTVQLDEAYRFRFSSITNAINSRLYQKKEQLTIQLRSNEHKLEEFNRIKNLIESDIRGEFMGMLERLNSVSSTYIAMIQHDVREIQNDLDRINNILTMVGENQDKVFLLKNSLRIRNDIETASIKPFRVETTVSPDILPRELVKIREIVDNYPALISLLQIKDDMI